MGVVHKRIMSTIPRENQSCFARLSLCLCISLLRGHLTAVHSPLRQQSQDAK